MDSMASTWPHRDVRSLYSLLGGLSIGTSMQIYNLFNCTTDVTITIIKYSSKILTVSAHALNHIISDKSKTYSIKLL